MILITLIKENKNIKELEIETERTTQDVVYQILSAITQGIYGAMGFLKSTKTSFSVVQDTMTIVFKNINSLKKKDISKINFIVDAMVQAMVIASAIRGEKVRSRVIDRELEENKDYEKIK